MSTVPETATTPPAAPAALAPDPTMPYWHGWDGARHSLAELRCGLNPSAAAEVEQRHLAAINRVAAAAIEAMRGGEPAEGRRLSCAAGRLCQEIAGLWPSSAVEVKRR